MNLADLKKPFAPDRISWRIGSVAKDKSKGMALAYIDARDVQDRLDEVCGVDGWQCRYVPMHDKKTVCEIGIRTVKTWVEQTTDGKFVRVPDEWIWKSDGAGDSDIEAEKGALSDAFKRAAVRWGVGRYLYDLESPWVALDDNRIAQHEYARLQALLSKQAAPASNGSKPSAAAPTYDQDPDGQVTAWVDQQKGFIKACKTVEDVQGWEEARKDALDRLKRKALASFNGLRLFKEGRIYEINTENLKEKA